MFLLAIFLLALTGCGSTSNKSEKTEKVVKQQESKPSQVAKKSFLTKTNKPNLLNYANPSFEKPIDGKVVKARADKGQMNLAEHGVTDKAALSGKQSLAVVLEKGGLKLSYGIWRLKDQIDPNKQYRFEFDAIVARGNAVFFSKVSESPWQRSPFKNTLEWQTVGNTIEGKFLAKGQPLHLHIDNIKNKDFAVVFIDNVRLYAID
ncbi:hypothetical protein [Paraglaciecola sp. L3A3]|uniref:hypothetical protein n=1 Tax=Paraglaciecola sp. L3A3 TaxID=2686358 RepID=UPI00131E3822|nr:hypothetical protein [Paraglaciecola sp. L3A3]